MKNISILLLLLLLTSCATAYQPEGLSGGYKEIKYSTDIVKILFQGNGYTSASTVADYCFLRAAEYTYENGFKYFYILGDNHETTSSTAQITPAQIQYNSYANSATYSAPTFITVNASSSSILIRISNDNKSGAVDALDVRNNLSKSLGVNLNNNERVISSEAKEMNKNSNFPNAE